MDRAIVFDDEQINASDIDYSNLFPMIGLAKLAKAVFGDGPFINDLTCVPTGPASLDVILNPGEIYDLQAIDATAYGPISSDAREILKQGIMMDAVTLSFTTPATPGQSIDYLIQVIYQDADTDPESRPFFGGSPQTVDTIRRGYLTQNVKAGIPAATGTQVSPTPDAGYTGAWVVTVANGQTQINSGDINVYPGAPFISTKLADSLTEAEADLRYKLKPAIASSVYMSTSQAVPSGDVITKIDFDTVEFDSNSFWDAVNKRFNLTQAGLYDVSAILNVLASGGSNNCALVIRKNGTLIKRISQADSFDTVGLSGSLIVSSSGTDYVDIAAASINGNTVGGDPTLSAFQIQYLGT